MGESDNNRRAKFYQPTAAGRRQLKLETERLARMSDGVEAGIQDLAKHKMIAMAARYSHLSPTRVSDAAERMIQ